MNAVSTATWGRGILDRPLLAAGRWLVILMPVCYLLNRVPTDIDLSLTVLLFLLRSAATRDWAWTRAVWWRIAMVAWVWMLAGSALALDHHLAYQQSLFWWRFPVYAAALEYWILDRTTMRRLLWMATAVVAAVSLDAWYQYLTGADVLGHLRQGDRLTGPFSDLRVGSWTQRLMFPVVLGAFTWDLWRRSGRGAAAGLAALIILTAGAVILSGERMATLLTLLGLVVAALLKKGMARKLILAGFGLLIAGGIVLALSTQWFLDRYVSQTEKVTAQIWDSAYGQIWHSALYIASKRPLIGVGPKNFRVACDTPGYALPVPFDQRCETHPHNLYLEWLVEYGAIGLALFLALIAAWAARIVPPLRGGTASPWLYGPAIAAFLTLWPLGPSGSFFSNWYGGVFYLAVGWALAAARLPQTSAEVVASAVEADASAS